MSAGPQTIGQRGTDLTRSMDFDRFAGASGITAGVAGVLYAIAFVVLQNPLLSGLWLLVGGLCTSVVWLALYSRLTEVSVDFARLALFLSGLGAFGALVHGGYDLASALHPPAGLSGTTASVPSAIDPRGLLTFGIAGLGMCMNTALMQRSARFPTGLVALGYLLSALLVTLYLGRLIVLDATSPLIVAPALLCGFLVNPLWNIWLGFLLGRRHAR